MEGGVLIKFANFEEPWNLDLQTVTFAHFAKYANLQQHVIVYGNLWKSVAGFCSSHWRLMDCLLPKQLYPDNSKCQPYLCFWSNASWPEREPQNLPFLYFSENVFLCISLKKWLPDINSWYLYLFQKDVIHIFSPCTLYTVRLTSVYPLRNMHVFMLHVSIMLVSMTHEALIWQIYFRIERNTE